MTRCRHTEVVSMNPALCQQSEAETTCQAGVSVMIGSTACVLVAGREYPLDRVDFRARFQTDEDCLDYLDCVHWAEGFHCPHCGNERAGRGASGYRCTGCRGRALVTSGGIFDKARIPPSVWFEAAWLPTSDKDGVAAARLYRVPLISGSLGLPLSIRAIQGASSTPRKW